MLVIKENQSGSCGWEAIQQLIFLCFQNSAVEMILSKQLSLNVQESMQNAQDEREVNELQNQPLELDIMLRNEQLKGMEVWEHENH